VYDGRVVEGHYVSPEAYAAFLRGVLAAEASDVAGALRAFSEALAEDDEDPEIHARIGELRCRLDPKDPEAIRSFDRALQFDPSSASVLAAKARCALARGDVQSASNGMHRALAEDPNNVGLGAEAVRLGARLADPSAEARAMRLTQTHSESPVAWDALVAWGWSRKRLDYIERGLTGLVATAPLRSGEVEGQALALAASGEVLVARRVSAAIADAPARFLVRGPRDATVARLAVDEALARGDERTALSRAVRGHVAWTEVAARAHLLGQRDIALRLSRSRRLAEPLSSGATMVLLALGEDVLPPLGGDAADVPPELCVLVYADHLARTVNAARASSWLSQRTRTKLAPQDALGAALSLDLVRRSVLPAKDLSDELRARLSQARD
jgi:hypothetical protein